MNLSKLRSGRGEFAVCVFVPILVLAAMVIPGRRYCLDWSQDLLMRQARLDQAPKMEAELHEACRVLKSFAAPGADGDKAAELTQVAEKAAQDFGFTTGSANVEKQEGESLSWFDYKVMFNGNGPLKSIIGMLDFLENPERRFQVAQATFRANKFGAGATYDGSAILLTRTVRPVVKSEADRECKAVATAQVIEQTARLRQITGSVKSWMTEKRAPVLALNPKKQAGQTLSGPATRVHLFVLNGIALDGKNPLAMTDRGTFGIGERVDGYTIVAISNDRVVLVDPNGRRETVALYKDEAN
jgi:hypothetical protein